MDAKAKEYHTQDKSTWGPGEWSDEPDKVEWVDEATGFLCLVCRPYHGGFCGYVGIPKSHPLFGKSYSDAIDGVERDPFLDNFAEVEFISSHFNVHGGLTFAAYSDGLTIEEFNNWRKEMFELRADSTKTKEADYLWRMAGHLVDDYEAWVAYCLARYVCHGAEGRKPGDVWWFGFDCAHFGDYCPAFARNPFLGREREPYRNLDYVKGEVQSLARQLKDFAERDGTPKQEEIRA